MITGFVVQGSQLPCTDATIRVGLQSGAPQHRSRTLSIGHAQTACREWATQRQLNHDSFAGLIVVEGMQIGVREATVHAVVAIVTLASAVVKGAGIVTDPDEIRAMLNDLAGYLAHACAQADAHVQYAGEMWRVKPVGTPVRPS